MRPRLLLMAAILGLASCDSASTTAPPPPAAGPLYAGTYYLQTADGDTLPAEISTRLVGVAQEKTMLDSASLTVNADSTYVQRYYLRILLNDALDRREAGYDVGTIAVEGFGFRLNSTVRTREFTLVVPRAGSLSTFEQLVFFENLPPITAGIYGPTRP